MHPHLEDDNAEVIFCIRYSIRVTWTTIGFVQSRSIIHTALLRIRTVSVEYKEEMTMAFETWAPI